MDNQIDIKISPTPLSLDSTYQFCLDKACGGNALFVGTVRDNNKGAQIRYLEFESYVPMALKVLRQIAEECVSKFNCQKISIHHRIGQVKLTEIAVIIAVSTKHRKEAFNACTYAIDALRSRAPIWKKEFKLDGSYWVNARP